MAQLTLLLFFLVIFAAIAHTMKAQVKQCEYTMVVHTGPTRGPTYKLWVILEAYGGDNINTTNLIKRWGDMGKGYTYFLPESQDSFKYQGPCLVANFCNIQLGGKKGELKPHWYIYNITVTTKVEGGNDRFKAFHFYQVGNEFEYTNPAITDGECP